MGGDRDCSQEKQAMNKLTVESVDLNAFEDFENGQVVIKVREEVRLELSPRAAGELVGQLTAALAKYGKKQCAAILRLGRSHQ